MAPGDLDRAICGMDLPYDPNVLTGIGGSEDAGVYRLDDDKALIQTIDFFTPIVDDPFIFGKAAAANALSDVYAMGGRPLTAMNVVCFPIKKLGIEPLRDILRGGLEILKEADTALVGGHSVEDDEPKYGLAVSGLVHPDKVMTNSALRPGDAIVLTKAVGTGVLATAIKGGLASSDWFDAMVRSICTINRKAAEVGARFNVRCCTDVTGFGLAGHMAEVARASHCKIRIHSGDVPLLDGALEAASMGLVPAGAYSNREFFGSWAKVAPGLTDELRDLMFDPQTSGGLLLGIPAAHAKELVSALTGEGVTLAAVIGEAVEPCAEGMVEIV
jgi:selenide, water dikinase